MRFERTTLIMRTSSSRINIVGRVTVLLFLAASTGFTQSASILERLHGSWRGDGKTMGLPATLHITWERVLAEKFLRLTLTNEMKRPTGERQRFEGHGYYQLKEGACEGAWFDSRGASFPIKCSLKGQSLIALWGAADTERGKSIYSLLADGRLEVVDSVMQKDGNFKEFGRFVLSRD